MTRSVRVGLVALSISFAVCGENQMVGRGAQLDPGSPPTGFKIAPPPAQAVPPAATSKVSHEATRVDTPGGYLVMKKVLIMDQNGYERPMPSASMLLPNNWQFQGGTTWNVKDNCNPIRTAFHATGPDGRALEVFPPYAWAWADDPRPLQVLYTQKAQQGGHACDVMAPMGAADYIRRNLSRIRPNAQLVALEPLPKVMQALQQQARHNEQMAAQYRLQQRVRPDVVRARLRYSINGQAMEEWIIATTMITGTMGPSMTPAGQMTQAFNYSCSASAFAERAPQGQLDSSGKFFDMLVNTLRVNAAWQQRVNGTQAGVFNAEQKGVADRVAINTKLAHDLDDIRQKQYAYQQRVEDHVFAQYSQAMLGLQTYRNPATGETFDLSNEYRHAWVNNRNEVVLTDQEGWDPSVALKGDWTPLQPVTR